MLFETRHAIGLLSDDGLNLLVHIGLETVNLKEKYFESKVKVGENFNERDILMLFDIRKIEVEGYNTITPIIITNSSEYQEVHAELYGGVILEAIMK